MNDRLVLSAPDIRDEDAALVLAALRSGTLSKGPYTARFEAAFADYVGAEHAVAVGSGTAGLHLCMRAAGVTEGAEVVTSPFAYVASANAVLYERATPVFVDIDETTMTIDPALAADALTGRTRAVLPVHVFGQPSAMDELAALCAGSGISLIEDSCQALGSEYRGRRIGSGSEFAVFSFFPNKQMTTGEGAMVTCRDERHAELMRTLRNQGVAKDGSGLVHDELGYNYRMTELSAALGVGQIGRIEEMLAMRERVAGWYRERLEQVDGAALLAPAPWTSRLSWFAAIARLAPGIDRDRIIERLAASGVPAKGYFAPLHLQPVYRSRFGYREGDFPVTERVARSTLALPFHNRMAEAQVDRVCEALGRAIAGGGA
ncbi:MAG TPA: DegT/DnrJ/EryC1/StrS family aminotransferase [Allosphingosinicella sp.]|jgi:perosamine synthetase